MWQQVVLDMVAACHIVSSILSVVITEIAFLNVTEVEKIKTEKHKTQFLQRQNISMKKLDSIDSNCSITY